MANAQVAGDETTLEHLGAESVLEIGHAMTEEELMGISIRVLAAVGLFHKTAARQFGAQLGKLDALGLEFSDVGFQLRFAGELPAGHYQVVAWVQLKKEALAIVVHAQGHAGFVALGDLHAHDVRCKDLPLVQVAYAKTDVTQR
ncbi:hypothetical protein D3C84_562010 [compost metagenome]